MKFGVNTFIWSAEFNQSNFPLLPVIKQAGFDGVEVPLFRPKEFDSVRNSESNRGEWLGMQRLYSIDGRT